MYLAVDIGASSGRHMLAWLENGKIRLEEVWRFENNVAPKNGHLCWNTEYLFGEILKGLKTGVITREDLRRSCARVVKSIFDSAIQQEYVG